MQSVVDSTWGFSLADFDHGCLPLLVQILFPSVSAPVAVIEELITLILLLVDLMQLRIVALPVPDLLLLCLLSLGAIKHDLHVLTASAIGKKGVVDTSTVGKMSRLDL